MYKKSLRLGKAVQFIEKKKQAQALKKRNPSLRKKAKPKVKVYFLWKKLH